MYVIFCMLCISVYDVAPSLRAGGGQEGGRSGAWGAEWTARKVPPYRMI